MSDFDTKIAAIGATTRALTNWRRARARKNLPNEALDSAIDYLVEYQSIVTKVKSKHQKP